MSVKNTADLRSLLLETIEGVKDGTIDPKKGSCIGGLTGKILQSAKLDLDFLKATKKTKKIGMEPFSLQLVNGAK